MWRGLEEEEVQEAWGRSVRVGDAPATATCSSSAVWPTATRFFGKGRTWQV